jgi:hypothetical protein
VPMGYRGERSTRHVQEEGHPADEPPPDPHPERPLSGMASRAAHGRRTLALHAPPAVPWPRNRHDNLDRTEPCPRRPRNGLRGSSSGFSDGSWGTRRGSPEPPLARPPAAPSSPWKKSSGTFSRNENLRFSRVLRTRDRIPAIEQAVDPQPASAR